MRVFVLLFNAGTENEGIHTIRMGENDYILMFEDEDDATRYAMLLEAQDFLEPAVEEIEQDEVEAFCQSAGYYCKLVPKGFVPQTQEERLLMAPPEQNLEETDWQRDKERQPEFSEAEAGMTDNELERIRRQLEGLL